MHYQVRRGKILEQFLRHWLGSNSVTVDLFGETRALSAVEIHCVNGQCWTLNGSEYRNGGVESLLSSILETGEVESRYFLKPSTCERLLNRMKIRGKKIPPLLEEALIKIANEQSDTSNI